MILRRPVFQCDMSVSLNAGWHEDYSGYGLRKLDNNRHGHEEI